MAEFIKEITISNFKSIKSSTIKGCKRVNLFIGRPNVGKSNILEALSLFSVPYLSANKSKNLNTLVRSESVTELFYSGNYDQDAFVETNLESVTLMLDKTTDLDLKFVSKENPIMAHYFFDNSLNLKKSRLQLYASRVKKYQFSSESFLSSSERSILIPPYGFNLYDVLERNVSLREEISNLFKDYQLELVFDRASRTLKILKKNTNSIFLVPYSSIADTLQRIIFYKTAIASNENSILLFEEPEAHSFPPYITHITQEMIYRKSNQYFIATHSPFILNDLLENARSELSVYIVDYKKHETRVQRLSEKTLHEIYQSGVDLFTNNETFI